MGALLQIYGTDLLRYKGILNVADNPNRVIFQGVHMLMDGTDGAQWQVDEKRQSTIVFIGRDLPRKEFEDGLNLCLV
jgi:G3E family GTPase